MKSDPQNCFFIKLLALLKKLKQNFSYHYNKRKFFTLFVLLLAISGFLFPPLLSKAATIDATSLQFTESLDNNFTKVSQGGSLSVKVTLTLQSPSQISLGGTFVMGNNTQLNSGAGSTFFGNNPLSGVFVGAVNKINNNSACSANTTVLNQIFLNCNFPYKSSEWPKGLSSYVSATTWQQGQSIVFDVALSSNDLQNLGVQFSDGGIQNEIYIYPVLDVVGLNTSTAMTPGKSLYIQAFNTAAQAQSSTSTAASLGLPGNGSVTATPQQTPAGSNPLIALLNEIVAFVLGLIEALIYAIFFYIVAPLITALLSIHPYQDSFVAVIYPGWEVVRNITNIFFILALIIIAMATLFRVSSYQFRQLLVQLIIAALLVNFSLVIGQAILGLADTVQAQFLGGNIDQVRVLGQALMTNTNSIIINYASGTQNTNAAAVNSNIFTGLIQSLFWLALSLGTLAVFIAIGAYLFIRIVALWLLLLISPIAYAVGILPSTAGYRVQWWQQFLKYAFFTPIMAFFLNMAAIMVGNAQNSPILGKLASQSSLTSIGGVANMALSVGSDALLLVFLIASLKVAEQAGIYGAASITSLAQKGIFAPFAAANYGLKAARNYGAEKVLEKTGVEVRPTKWLEGWKHSREENKAKREATGKAVALAKGSPFGNPTSFFQRYWNPSTIGRIFKGGDARGRKLLAKADKVKQQYLNEQNPEKKEKLLENYRHLVHQGKHLIAPTDYHTQRELRGSISEEKNKIHSENWHELVDLFNAAVHEKESIRAAAIATKLTETYNENELINHSRYTRAMTAEESADGEAHKEGDFFEYSAEGAENFRKLILDEQLGLGKEVSMQIMSDMSDIAESHNHREIMRMYGSKDGKLYFKKKDERVPEVVAEMNKLEVNKILAGSNRLVGNKEIPAADYDITDRRRAVLEPALLTFYMQNYSAVGFLAGRGQINASQAKAAYENQDVILNAASLLDDKTPVPDPADSESKKPGYKPTKTARQLYKTAMQTLIDYGSQRANDAAAEEGEVAATKTKVEAAMEFMEHHERSKGSQTHTVRPNPPPPTTQVP